MQVHKIYLEYSVENLLTSESYWPSPVYSSPHSNDTNCFAVFSQTLHISRLWSNYSDWGQNKEKMRSWYVKREYPEKLIDAEIWTAKFNTRETNRKNKSKNGVPVVSLPFVRLPFSLQYH